MKYFTTLFLALTFSFSATAASFSAFSQDRKLYVTMLVDDCNNHNAQLSVSPLCQDDRLIKNYAVSCEADLMVTSTLMWCDKVKYYPEVFTLDLDQQNVAKEAKTLTLKMGSETVTVEL